MKTSIETITEILHGLEPRTETFTVERYDTIAEAFEHAYITQVALAGIHAGDVKRKLETECVEAYVINDQVFYLYEVPGEGLQILNKVESCSCLHDGPFYAWDVDGDQLTVLAGTSLNRDRSARLFYTTRGVKVTLLTEHDLARPHAADDPFYADLYAEYEAKVKS